MWVIECPSIPGCVSHQVVSQTNHFQIEGVSGEVPSGDFAHGEIFPQFTDARLHAGSPIIEMPDPSRSER